MNLLQPMVFVIYVSYDNWFVTGFHNIMCCKAPPNQIDLMDIFHRSTAASKSDVILSEIVNDAQIFLE